MGERCGFLGKLFVLEAISLVQMNIQVVCVNIIMVGLFARLSAKAGTFYAKSESFEHLKRTQFKR